MPIQAETAGTTNLELFVRNLRVDQTASLHSSVAAATAIHETSFFRDRKSFDMLRETILPRLIADNSATRRLRIWSAASSTGQEAYSVAMLLCDDFPAIAEWDVKILGTDISPEVIEYARRGIYRRIEVNRGLPARMLVKYLERDGDEWQVAPKLRSMCEFLQTDLCTPLPHLPLFDLVLLRNVLFHIPEQDRGTVFRVVHRQMAPGGYLTLGASVRAEDSTNLFEPEIVDGFYFYRPSIHP